MRAKSGLRRRGSGVLKGQPITRPGAAAHARGLLPSLSSDSGIPGPKGVRMASTMGRFRAYVVDYVVTLVAVLVLWAVVDRVADQGTRQALDGVRGPVDEAIGAAYFVGLWTGGRRTLGMWWLGIRVIRRDDAGPVTIGSAVIRWGVMFLPVVIGGWLLPFAPLDAFLLVALGVFFVTWGWPLTLLASVVRSPLREGLHDRMARTAVVVSRA